MKKLFTLILILSAAAVLMPSLAYAAKAPAAAPTQPVGYDIGWPQCGKVLPSDQAFGIVGVNGGNAANTNPCLAAQLVWAAKSTGTSAQPKTQLYVNTANPGEVINQITTWPTSNTDKTGYESDNPYGTCSGGNDRACSWQYGWNRAVEDILDRFKPAAAAANVSQDAASYVWWLDVETQNTWQSGTAEALARNTAALEGMVAHFRSAGTGAKVGLYSTAYQWGQIVGSPVPAASNLNGLVNWRPGGANLSTAKQACSAAPLTPGGKVVLTQYISKNLDYNYSCP